MLAVLLSLDEARLQGFLGDARPLVSETLRNWQNDNVSRLAASFAGYTSFSIAPALVIGLVVAGAVVGDLVAQEKFISEMRDCVGPETTTFIVDVVR